MDLYRYSAAFPELVIPVLGHLKKFAKLTKVDTDGCLCLTVHYFSRFGELPGCSQMQRFLSRVYLSLFAPTLPSCSNVLVFELSPPYNELLGKASWCRNVPFQTPNARMERSNPTQEFRPWNFPSTRTSMPVKMHPRLAWCVAEVSQRCKSQFRSVAHYYLWHRRGHVPLVSFFFTSTAVPFAATRLPWKLKSPNFDQICT